MPNSRSDVTFDAILIITFKYIDEHKYLKLPNKIIFIQGDGSTKSSKDIHNYP